MKYIIVFVIIVLTLVTLSYFVLQIWVVNLFDAKYLTKTYSIVGILSIFYVLLILIISFFFGGNRLKYDKNSSGVAQRKLYTLYFIRKI